MSKVAREVAEAEVTLWLDKKKIFTSQREEQKASIEILIDAICEGVLVLEETTNCFTQTLLFPLEGELPVKELKYKSRINDKIMQPHLVGVKPSDADGRLLALLAALTATPKGVLAAIDSSDKRIGTSIAVFFL